MFNLPEFLLRPRRTYAPTGNPMIDLGWETPGDVMSDTRQARTPATISYRDTLAQRQNPLMEAAQDNQINMPVAPISDSAPGRSITFTTPGGVETARYGADNAFAGGNYRGQGYATLNDRPAAMDAFSRLQGARETGISGMPSVEGIMQNQLGGLPMAPEQKRVMALGLQDKLVNPLAALERDRVQGQFGVQEAEARRRDYLSSKQSEILGYHMSQFLEQNPDATPEQIATHRDRIAMANGMAIPRAAGVAPALALAGPASRDREGTARALRTLVSDAEYNRGSMGEMLDRLAGSPDEDRPALIKAMLETRRNPVAGYAPNALRDALFQSVAYDVLKAAPDRLGSLKEGERMSPEGGLPFDIVRSGDGILNPLAAIVTRTGENIPLPWSARPSAITRGKMTQQELEQIRRRLAVAPSVLESILGGNR